MVIKNISLINYRNIEKMDIELSEGINLLYGNNAQGKTNILEAIYMCASGRSMRTHISKEIIKFGKESAHIQLIVDKGVYRDKINIHIKKNNKKGIAVNNIPVKSINELFGTVNIVFFSPSDLMLIKEGPSYRRRYVDIELCQLSRIYADNLSRYYKILKERNTLLKDEKADDMTLDVYDSQLVEYGKKIIEDRNRFINEIGLRADIIHSEISSGERLEIKYLPNVSEKNYEKKMYECRKKDIFYKSTSVGIHRDDISFNINGINARDYGSQGQHRTICLSLKLAEVEFIKEKTGYSPILLLDDVLSELDRKRQLYIFNSIKNIQTVITSTGIDEFAENIKENIKIFYIKNGSIEISEKKALK